VRPGSGLFVAAAFVLSAALPCAAGASSTIDVWVSILPQAYFVERIGGDRVSVHVLVGPGQSPATYDPSPKQLAGLRQAEVLIRIGAPFEEALLDKIAAIMPGLEIVDGRDGIELAPIAGERHHGHGHGHGRLDPHVWLDPLLMKTHSATICATLCELDPDHAAAYRSRLESLEVDLDSTHLRIAARLEPFSARSIFVFHPAYGYFARRYGLRQIAVEVEGKEPSVRQLVALVEGAADSRPGALFVQPQISHRSAAVLASAIGAEVVALDPLARDYLDNLDRMAERIAASLGE
jgi:zinc transport system substrate-binding protein